MREDIIQLPSTEAEQPLHVPMVGIAYCDKNYKMTRKCFWSCCIEYIVQGSGTLEINGNVFHPSQGDVCIFPTFSDYSCRTNPDDPWIKMWIDARGILPNELLHLYNIENLYVIENLNFSVLFKKIFDTAANKTLTPNESHFQMSLYFYEMIQKIAIHVQKNQSEISDEAKTLRNYIDRNVDCNVSIKDLSALIYRSPSQTIRIFKKAFQCTPYDYAANLKIETAKLYLKNTSMQIKEIAARVGFSDEHYFSTVFRSKTGMSPRDFRSI